MFLEQLSRVNTGRDGHRWCPSSSRLWKIIEGSPDGRRPYQNDTLTELPVHRFCRTSLVADAWTALADPTRREIFSRLAARPRSVTELASELPVSRPAVSQHLRVVKDADLVRVRPEGTRRIYAVDPDGVRAMRAELESFWSAALTNFELARRGRATRNGVKPQVRAGFVGHHGPGSCVQCQQRVC